MSSRSDIKSSLCGQLKNKGCDRKKDAHFFDLVEDYLKLYDTKMDLYKDIEERGVVCKWQNGPDSYGYKQNDSVANLNKVNMQMLKILQFLGLKPPDEVVEDDQEKVYKL